MDILGVRVDNLKKEEILEKISVFLSENKFRKIATINQEIILKSQDDREFKNILSNCDLNIADSIGIKFAFWRKGEKLKCRMAGIDLMLEILRIANEKKLKIYLVANSRGLSDWEETKDAILSIYPEVEINGINIDKTAVIRSSSHQVNGDIVFCNFGAPFQEKFLFNQKNANIKLAVGVGGSFDYLTGKLKRAPEWMQFFGVEWFWRLLLQPKRIKRIFRAVIEFPIKVILNQKT